MLEKFFFIKKIEAKQSFLKEAKLLEFAARFPYSHKEAELATEKEAKSCYFNGELLPWKKKRLWGLRPTN